MVDTANYAGIGRRFVAQIIDVVVLFVIAYVIALGTGDTTGTGFNIQGGPAFLWFAIGAGYFILLEGKYGQTVGKRLTGIIVTTVDGGDIDIQASLIRNVLRVVDGFLFYAVGAILILLSDREQRLGDRVANTVVLAAD